MNSFILRSIERSDMCRWRETTKHGACGGADTELEGGNYNILPHTATTMRDRRTNAVLHGRSERFGATQAMLGVTVGLVGEYHTSQSYKKIYAIKEPMSVPEARGLVRDDGAS